MDQNQEKDYRVFCPDGTSYVLTSSPGGRPALEFHSLLEQRRRAKVRVVGLAMAKAMGTTITEMQVDEFLKETEAQGYLTGKRVLNRIPVARPDGELRPEDAEQFFDQLGVLNDVLDSGRKVIGTANPDTLNLTLPVSSHRLSMASPNRSSLPWMDAPIVTGLEGVLNGGVRGVVHPDDPFYNRKLALGYVNGGGESKIDLKEFMESEEGKRIIGNAILEPFGYMMDLARRAGDRAVRSMRPGDLTSMMITDSLQERALRRTDVLPVEGLEDFGEPMTPPSFTRRLRMPRIPGLSIKTAKAPILPGYLNADRERSAMNYARSVANCPEDEFILNVSACAGAASVIVENLSKTHRHGESNFRSSVGAIGERMSNSNPWYRPAYAVAALAYVRNRLGAITPRAGFTMDDIVPMIIPREVLMDFPADYIYANIASLFFCEDLHAPDPNLRHTEAWWDQVVVTILKNICLIDTGAVSDEGQAYWKNRIKDGIWQFCQEEGVFDMMDETRKSRGRIPFSDRQIAEPKVWAYNWVWSTIHFMPSEDHEMYGVDKKSDKFWSWMERRARTRCQEKMEVTARLHGFSEERVKELDAKFEQAIVEVLPTARKKFSEE